MFKASGGGHTESLKVLLEHGADVDKANNDGATPLYIGAHPTLHKTTHPTTLLSSPPDTFVHPKPLTSLTPDIGVLAPPPNLHPHTTLPHTLISHTLHTFHPKTASQKGHTESQKMLLEHGADVNKADNDGFTPLYIGTHPTS